MLRAILWITKFVFYTLYLIFPLLWVTILDKKNNIEKRDNFVNKTALKWAKTLIQWSGSTVTVTGNENIPKEGGVLFVSNHQSNMDIPLLMGYVNRKKGFISKLEVKKLPVISLWMKYIGCIFIDRHNVRQSLKVINEGAEMLRNGHSLVISPEGTRSSDGRLGEFKPGSLKLATKAKVTIVPITLIGSSNMMPKHKFEVRPSKIEIIISKPILFEELVNTDTNSVTELIRNIILKNLDNKDISSSKEIKKCC